MIALLDVQTNFNETAGKSNQISTVAVQLSEQRSD